MRAPAALTRWVMSFRHRLNIAVFLMQPQQRILTDAPLPPFLSCPVPQVYEVVADGPLEDVYYNLLIQVGVWRVHLIHASGRVAFTLTGGCRCRCTCQLLPCAPSTPSSPSTPLPPFQYAYQQDNVPPPPGLKDSADLFQPSPSPLFLTDVSAGQCGPPPRPK